MAEVNVKELASYIQRMYYDEKQKRISPIKLQKSLYFLFAYWGGIVRKSRINKEFVEEDYSDFEENLFDGNIEAWTYGPVVPEVYHEENLDYFYNERIFENKERLEDFVNGLLKELFEVSDFTLVEISHRDNCWVKNFKYEDEFHNHIISKEDIIHEYARK